ncbi:MAG: hypothetical protein GDA46_00735 [Bdellovibrionales bacterium]|nr:hypothetical protein [Bdellovibrionales bacterium]
MRKLFLAISFIFPLVSLAIVDTRSAGYSKTFSDFKMNTLEVKRTYNSRSIYNGLFGFGWCSNIETKLRVLPDDTVKVVECGGGMEISYHTKGKSPDTDLYIEKILEELKRQKVPMSPKNLEQLKRDLKASSNLRSNFLNTLNIQGTAAKGLKYYARGRVKEYILVTSSGYVRHLANGNKELFDKQGRLVKFKINNSTIEISWNDNKIEIINDIGIRLELPLNKEKKVTKILNNKKTIATYNYDDDNLVRATNKSGTYQHQYDKLYNLIKTIYPDKTKEELRYNTKKDWVIGFTDKRGCKESYDYRVNSKNPNHYFSDVEKVCGRKIVNKSKYEFWHKDKKEGGKYLHRARVEVNGRIETDVTYHPNFATPISFFRNGIRTKRKYDANGLLKEKDNERENVKYKNYSQKCVKPELVQIGYKDPNTKKIVKTESISFQFDSKCKLRQAKKSNDEWIKISHNRDGQIMSMEDQSRKKIQLTWNKKFNKPSMITREGIGSIQIIYDSKGEATTLKGLDQDPTVVSQVVSVFNNFLKTLTPVAGEMVIL